MSLTTSFGPALGAEISYRRERLVQAGAGTRRVRRSPGRRVGHDAAAIKSGTGRIGLAHPA